MPIKIIIEIQKNLYDFWECRTLEKGEPEYNDVTERLEHTLILNRQAISQNYESVIFKYESEEARDADLEKIRTALKFHEAVLFIND